MSTSISRTNLAGRRSELLAELFLEELDPVFVSRPTEDLGYDLLVGFSNQKGGINTFAVLVKHTEHAPALRFPISQSTLNRFAHSNIPGLLLVTDVKENLLYYGWLNRFGSNGNRSAASVPLTKIDDIAKCDLHKEFRKADFGVAATG